MTVQERILQFLREKNRDKAIEADTELFQSGAVNSLFALEIVMFVEDEFHIKLKKNDLKIENFSTVERIAALVERTGGAR